MTTALELWDKLRQQPHSWIPSEKVWPFVLTENERKTVLDALYNANKPQPEDGGITQALVQMARDNAIEECALIADKHRGHFYEHDKFGADIGGEIRALLSTPQSPIEAPHK